MIVTRFVGLVGLLASTAAVGLGAEELVDETFAAVRKLIQPQPRESLWRHVAWQTSLTSARRKAAAEGKPLLIWSGGGSAPLGGC